MLTIELSPMNAAMAKPRVAQQWEHEMANDKGL